MGAHDLSEFERISEHIYRLELTAPILNIFSFPVAVWLVRAEEGWTLVDAGTPETADQVVAAITRTTGGQGPSQILLTHGHFDHGGGLAAIRMAWNSPILCHEAEVPFVTGELGYGAAQSQNLLYKFTSLFMRQSVGGQPVARALQPGEAAAGMAVIHLPGHTPGQIGFLHPADEAMICGDAVMNFRGRLSAPFRAATADLSLARRSIERLAELDYAHLLPSHGPAIMGEGRARVMALLGRRSAEEPSDAW